MTPSSAGIPLSQDAPVAIMMVALFQPFRPNERLAVLRRWTTAEEMLDTTHYDVELAIGRSLRGRPWRPRNLFDLAQKTMEWADQRGVKLISIADRSYPPLLREIYDPPVALFARGEADVLTSLPPIAVVGTRNPDYAGVMAADQLGREAARLSIPVASGLARGIDSAVHRGVTRQSGAGIAVLGSGIDDVTPRSNRGLAAALLDLGGVVISEYAPGVPAQRHHFPARNRIITGISGATIIVQAPDRSGALISADYALDQGRDVYVHRSGIQPKFGGTVALERQGAVVIDTLEDINGTTGRNPNATGDATSDATGNTERNQVSLDEANSGMDSGELDRIFGIAPATGSLKEIRASQGAASGR